MPSLVSKTTGDAFAFPKMFFGLLKSYWWVIVLMLVVGFAIYMWYKYRTAKINNAFRRRKMEIAQGAKMSKSPDIKNVYIHRKGNYELLGPYLGHINVEVLGKSTAEGGKVSKTKVDILYVLVSRGFILNIIEGPKLITAPADAVRSIWVDKKKAMLLIGDSISYDSIKDMFFVEGKWKGLNVTVSKDLIDKNILEMFQDYTAKLLQVQDQTVQQLDLDLKKKLKGVEDVVDDE